MAYDEVGGCRKSGFFHGECPILETGRQSHAKAKEQEKAAHRDNYAHLAFCACGLATYTSLAQKESYASGFYLWVFKKHPAECMHFLLSFHSSADGCRHASQTQK